MNKEVEKYARQLASYLYKKYNKYSDEKSKLIDEEIHRKINLSMSNACEDGVAKLVLSLLGKEYKCIVDTYLSCESKGGKQYRPDITIIKPHKNGVNEILAIIEVKAQMGYCGVLKPSNFENKIDRFQKYQIKFSDKEYDNLKPIEKSFYLELGVNDNHKYIECTISKNFNIFVVNVLASNHTKNVEETINYFEKSKSETANFYALYGKDAWYDNIGLSSIYELDDKEKNNINQEIRKRHGFEQFITDIKNLLK